MFHVFLDGAIDRTPEGVQRLIEAIAKHYGMPIEALSARVRAGRFRVKGNVDRATADRYVRDLERLGGRCSIEPAGPDNRAATPLPFPAVRPGTPPPVLSQPPAAQSAFSSGLAAAFTSAPAPATNLSALDQGTLSLASVDGSDGDASAAAPAPSPGLPASFGPPPEKPKSTAPRLNLFAPPEASAGELKVELSTEDVERTARKAASAAAAAPPPSPPPVMAQPAVVAPPRDGKLLGDPRARLAIGVALAILLGFVPAHLVSAWRERSAFAAIDDQVEAEGREADTPEAYDGLDATRTSLLQRKYDARRNIAIMGLLIWAAAGAGLAYGWFRRIDWSRLEA